MNLDSCLADDVFYFNPMTGECVCTCMAGSEKPSDDRPSMDLTGLGGGGIPLIGDNG